MLSTFSLKLEHIICVMFISEPPKDFEKTSTIFSIDKASDVSK